MVILTPSTEGRGPVLEERHRRQLFDESGIHPKVAAERGYRTTRKRAEIPDVFHAYQRRVPALLIPTHSPDGTSTGYQLRPDNPRRRNGKVIKYETPGGSRCILDIHPSMRAAAGDPGVPLYVTEGIKKGDALTSRGLCTVGLTGVWNFQRDGELLPDWKHIALAGRQVVVVYDSDVMVKPEVQIALEQLVGALSARGARVQVVYLPDAEDGGKQGVDDWLVAGGTAEELNRMAREFVPTEVGKLRLSRNERLRRSVEELHAIRRGMPAQTMGQNTRRAVMRALIDKAERHGRPVAGGVRIVVGRRELAEDAASSVAAVNRAIAKLEEDGRLRRDNEGREQQKAGALVLLTRRAPAVQYGRGQGGEREGQAREGVDRGEPVARAPVPELRWPFVVAVREKDALGRVRAVYEQVRRLGKKRGAVVEHLLENGGSATIPELMERFAGKKTRPRDFKGRVLADLAGWRYAADLRKWVTTGPQIIEVEGEVVRLREDWLDALDIAREMGDEQGAAERQKINHELQQISYRDFLAGKHPPDPAPTEEEMAEGREERQKRRKAAHLVAEGMSPHVAAEEVLGADGWIEDLRPAVEDDPSDEHPLECECLGCSARSPSYARMAE